MAPQTRLKSKKETDQRPATDWKEDPEMPFLRLALDPETAQLFIENACSQYLQKQCRLYVQSTHLLRHKMRRRCVIEYNVVWQLQPFPDMPRTLLGKARARPVSNRIHQLQAQLQKRGLTNNHSERFSTPRPFGVIPELRMWLQEKVAGHNAEEHLLLSNGWELARRIGHALAHFHRTGPLTDRSHGIDDELSILKSRLNLVAVQFPPRAKRIQRLFHACIRCSEGLVPDKQESIHRDFYPAQVIVDGNQLWLVDFDLYCLGDPALDAGNFVAHLTELSLRQSAQPDGLAKVESAFVEEFLNESPQVDARSIAIYKTLALARHIYLSTQFPERIHTTKLLIELCEQRVNKHPSSARYEIH